MLVIVGSGDNDVVQLLIQGQMPWQMASDVEAAVEMAAPLSGVLVFAPTYPKPGPAVRRETLAQAIEKHLRVYVEYPTAMGDTRFEAPQLAHWERAIVTSDFWDPDLTRGSLLSLHQAWILPTQAEGRRHLIWDRVRGYDHLEGEGPGGSPALLWEYAPDIWVGTSALSRWHRYRYFPQMSWAIVWRQWLEWLDRSEVAPSRSSLPALVRPRFGPDDPLPATVEASAIERAVRWFETVPVVSHDGSPTVLEGVESTVDYQGRQRLRAWVRADCLAETAMVFAQEGVRSGNPAHRALAVALLDTLWQSPEFVEADPACPWQGLVRWYPHAPYFYGDDNARVILATLAAGQWLGESRWHRPVVTALLANLRTTGACGFHQKLLTPDAFGAGATGWQSLAEERLIYPNPHMEAYLWAANLWMYAATGYRPLLTSTTRGIRHMMAAYPHWIWMNGWTQELARMLLPLAWLMRVEDTVEHRQWFERIGQALAVYVVDSGAIAEHLGPAAMGIYPPPGTDVDYGTQEASLIQRDGDPVCDLLYSTNFAAVGLHEAGYGVAPGWRALEDRVMQFLCRIQIEAPQHPLLHGAWMRGFDYHRWEFGGQSADAGWGPWAVESGWTNTWVTTILQLRQRQATLWSLEGELPSADLLAEVALALGLPADGDAFA